MDKNPAYGDILDNLDLFKIQKKCFNSINWSPRVSTSHNKKLENKVKKFKQINHIESVRKRCQYVENLRVNKIQKDMEVHSKKLNTFKNKQNEDNKK